MISTTSRSARVDSPSEVARRIIEAAERHDRFLVALAGPPGAGKSHRSEQLFQAIEAQRPGRAAVVPMDGYHLDNAERGSAGDPS